MPIDLTAPFRGSTAIAEGLLTPGVLRGRRYQRLFPDVFASALLEADLALRARAAGVLVAGRGVVAGYAAAELWGASCGPPDVPIDVLLPQDYRCDGLRVHRDGVDPDEVTWLGPTPVSTPDRAAFDLARWAPDLTERVVAVDALTHFCKVDPDAVRTLLAIEYDGAEHRSQRRARRDLLREAALTALGWLILRFDSDVVLFRPDRLVQVVRAELAARGVL
jgi:hypothetical protein